MTSRELGKEKEKLKEARKKWILDALVKNPNLTRNHFYKCGYSYAYLDRLVAEEGVSFGIARSKHGGVKKS